MVYKSSVILIMWFRAMSCFDLQDFEGTKFCITRQCRRALSGSTATWPTCLRWTNVPLCLLQLTYILEISCGWYFHTGTTPTNHSTALYIPLCFSDTVRWLQAIRDWTWAWTRGSTCLPWNQDHHHQAPPEELLVKRPFLSKKSSLSSVQIFVKEHTWKYGHGVHSVNHRQFSTSVTMRVCWPDQTWQISRSIQRPDLS